MAVYFIDTGYHFEESIQYKNDLTALLGLNTKELRSEPHTHGFTLDNQTWEKNQDLCCFINKINPINKIKDGYDVWVSGLFAYQNANRNSLNIFEPSGNLIKFHPNIDMTKDEVSMYTFINELPSHPLLDMGYSSVGCVHCTQKGDGRKGRWSDITKVECELHLLSELKKSNHNKSD